MNTPQCFLPSPLLNSLFILAFGLIPPSWALGDTLYDSGDPSADEQLVLEIINRARANPAAEGTRLGIDISEGLPPGATDVSAKPPLAMNKRLLGAARAHSLDMYTRKFFAHTNLDGKDAFNRITAAGYSYSSAGENIAASGSSSADALEDLLMVDKNQPGRGHRRNLLNTNPAILFREIGIGFYSGPVQLSGIPVNGLKNFITQDFGSTATGPFILGVVYNDINTNGFYDIGEGLSGVTVTADAGDQYAVTGAAGGYAFPISASGEITVIAAGGQLPSAVEKKITLSGANQKVDILRSEAPAGNPDPGAGPGPQGSASIEIKSASGSLDFRRKGPDVMKFTALLNGTTLPASLAKLPVKIFFGELSRSVKLNKQGKAVRGDTTVSLKRGKNGAPHTLTFRVEGSDFSKKSPFNASGMNGSIGVKNQGTSVSGSIDIGGGAIPFSVNVTYSAKAGKSGGFRKAK